MNAEEAARVLGCADKTVRRHIKKGTIEAKRKESGELDIAEDQVEKLRLFLDSKRALPLSTQSSTDMSTQMESLVSRVVELEQRVTNLEEAKSTHVSTPAPLPVLSTPSPPPPQPHASQPRTDLPDGSMLATEFARIHGVKRETFRDHLTKGIGKEKEKAPASNRPKPGREFETEWYLTPDQQRAALDFWERHGVRFDP